ncbi:MAG: 5-methyltetrahydropteroyltriglutamate--homocysteine methyltransferase, partial [Chloroflexi bacterium]|nr:5-methyltetrahydropteroyltriglutamate--homocysteine methyltransferase [Chloroflexota bacterium]
MPPLTTTVIGSWPKPPWLSSGDHDISGWATDREWRFQGEELKRKQDEATEWALLEQEATGVDIVSDGEQRRDNYVYYFCRRLRGFDFERRARIAGRSGAWDWIAPVITGPVAARDVLLAADYRFARMRTERLIKMTIPGPMTIIDSAIDEYYGDDVALAMDLAAAIRTEVESLAAAGCDVVEFDEPVFARYPKKVLDYGLRALEACFEGITGITTVVHICCGYPVEGYDKAESDSYTHLAPMLAGSKIDQISIEGAHRPLDLEVLQRFGDKDIIVGVVDVGEPRIETSEEIEVRIRQVLAH